MKMKSFFMLALASVVLFIACSSDDDGQGDGVVIDPKGKAWISLSIKNPSQGNTTRSLNSTNQDPATAAETDVVAVRAIFFDTGLAVTSDILLSSAEAGSPGQPGGSPGDAFQVDATSAYIMIVINPPSGYPTTWAGGTLYSAVNAAVSADVSTITGSTFGFMMTNSKGDLEPSTSTGTLTALTLYNTAANAQSNPLAINVDRVVSKVRLYTATATTPGATVSEIGWVLNVTNKLYFPQSKRMQTFLNTTTPFDQYGLGSYREDPNYNNTSITFPGSTYDANYSYYSDGSTVTWTNAVDASTPGALLYCLENTQRKEDNSQAYITQILLKAKYLPTSYTLSDGSTTSTQGTNDDWLRISGRYYTYTTLMDWIGKELTDKYAQADPALYSTPIANAFNSYLTAIGLTAVTIPNTPGTVAATVLADFTALKTTVEAKTNRAGTYGSVTYYAEGISYYKIMIRHDDDNVVDNNELGEFGMVRNSVYDVNVTAFNNPGNPTITDPDPDEPGETEDGSWLSVQININPWAWYKQNVIL